MKKLTMVSFSVCVMMLVSSGVFAAQVAEISGLAGPSVLTPKCTVPSDWIPVSGYHEYARFNCMHIQCVLTVMSGGVPNGDPKKSTFWQKVGWNFEKKGTSNILYSGQCTTVAPGYINKLCHGIADGAITCSTEYTKHVMNHGMHN